MRYPSKSIRDSSVNMKGLALMKFFVYKHVLGTLLPVLSTHLLSKVWWRIEQVKILVPSTTPSSVFRQQHSTALLTEQTSIFGISKSSRESDLFESTVLIGHAYTCMYLVLLTIYKFQVSWPCLPNAERVDCLIKSLRWNKNLSDEAETNIQNYYAFVGNGG